jgi:hypothetical protein
MLFDRFTRFIKSIQNFSCFCTGIKRNPIFWFIFSSLTWLVEYFFFTFLFGFGTWKSLYIVEAIRIELPIIYGLAFGIECKFNEIQSTRHQVNFKPLCCAFIENNFEVSVIIFDFHSRIFIGKTNILTIKNN